MVEAKHTIACSSSRNMAKAQTHHVEVLTLGRAATAEAVAFRTVFEQANRFSSGGAPYAVSVAPLEEQHSPMGSSSMSLAQPLSKTVIVTGPPDAADDLYRPSQAQAWKRLLMANDRLIACSGGTFLLAALGLLDSRVAVVHWGMQERFRERFPMISSDATKLYSKDHGIYTCAGGVASFDCALTLVEEDFGNSLAGDVARSLLLPHRRSGDTDQVSALLKAQATVPDMLTKLLAWLPDHLKDELSVGLLASRAAMSQRNFARVFQQRTGMTPARYVERLRFEAAQSQLRGSHNSISQAAAASGFNTVETLRRVFLKRLGMTPGQFRQGRTHPAQWQSNAVQQQQDSSAEDGVWVTRRSPLFSGACVDCAAGLEQ